jgi:Zn-dependent oligopeptidase
VTTIDGLPPTSQQFKADDAAFETALDTAQSSVSHLPANSTAQQVTQAVQPLMTAADLFQSQIANLEWSATGKPRAQFLSEDVGQLVAEIVAIERPGGFLSVGQVVVHLSTAANTLRATSDSLDAQLGS